MKLNIHTRIPFSNENEQTPSMHNNTNKFHRKNIEWMETGTTEYIQYAFMKFKISKLTSKETTKSLLKGKINICRLYTL